MDVEIVYYEQEDGVLQKVAELVVQTQEGASLGQICKDALQKVGLFVIRLQMHRLAGVAIISVHA